MYICRQQIRHALVLCTDPHGLWKMSHRAQEEFPRTTNDVEGWHRELQLAVASRHSNL